MSIKVGSKILVIRASQDMGRYKNGDLLTIRRVYDNDEAVDVAEFSFPGLNNKEFVVVPEGFENEPVEVIKLVVGL